MTKLKGNFLKIPFFSKSTYIHLFCYLFDKTGARWLDPVSLLRRPGSRVLSAAKPHPVRPRPARPSPLRCIPGRRQPVGVRAVTGETEDEPPRTRLSAIGQRGRPAAVPPRRCHAKKEHCLLKFSSHPPPTNHSARRRPCPPLHSSPGCSVIGQWRWRAATVLPRHVIFVVAQKRRIGKNPILYLFYLSFLVRLLTVQLAVVVVLLFCSLRMPIALSASRRPPRSCRGA